MFDYMCRTSPGQRASGWLWTADSRRASLTPREWCGRRLDRHTRDLDHLPNRDLRVAVEVDDAATGTSQRGASPHWDLFSKAIVAPAVGARYRRKNAIGPHARA